MHRFLRFVLGVAGRLPLRLLHAAGGLLGWAIYGISPKYRAHMRFNLAQAGYRDATIRREAIVSAGCMLTELPALWFRPYEEVVALVREVTGAEAVFGALERGKSLLLLTPHMGCFEITAQYAARHTPITVLYRAPKIGVLEPLMREGRSRPNVRLVPADLSGVREIFASLKRGEPLGFLPDQVPGEGEGEWAEFFGRPAYTMTLVGRLQQASDAAVVFCYAERLAGGKGFKLHFAALDAPLSLDRLESARQVNERVEGLVRQCPVQYLWGYNRYKRPAGAPAPPRR